LLLSGTYWRLWDRRLSVVSVYFYLCVSEFFKATGQKIHFIDSSTCLNGLKWPNRKNQILFRIMAPQPAWMQMTAMVRRQLKPKPNNHEVLWKKRSVGESKKKYIFLPFFSSLSYSAAYILCAFNKLVVSKQAHVFPVAVLLLFAFCLFTALSRLLLFFVFPMNFYYVRVFQKH